LENNVMKTKAEIRVGSSCSKRDRSLWTVAALLLCSTHALFGQSLVLQPTALIYNLNVPGSQQGVGNIVAVLPGSGYGVGFINGPTPYSLNSVTLELVGTSLPAAGFGVHFYSFVPALGASGSNIPVNLAGELGNPVVSSQPTLYPGQTTYITFTPTSPIIIAPNSDYMIGATEDANGNNDNGLLFAPNASAYTVAGGVQMFAPDGLPFVAQWYFDQSSDVWSLQPSGYNGELKIELDASPAPEPSALVLILTGCAACVYGSRKRVQDRKMATTGRKSWAITP
jgi:hypothetical protein